ncbi:MAG: hypothetical protein ACR2LL_05815 [Nitrosopumilus sp.]
MQTALAITNAPAIKTKFFMMNSPSSVNKKGLSLVNIVSCRINNKEKVETRCITIMAMDVLTSVLNTNDVPTPISIMPNANTNVSVGIPGIRFSAKGVTGETFRIFKNPNQRNTVAKDNLRIFRPYLFTNEIS